MTTFLLLFAPALLIQSSPQPRAYLADIAYDYHVTDRIIANALALSCSLETLPGNTSLEDFSRQTRARMRKIRNAIFALENGRQVWRRARQSMSRGKPLERCDEPDFARRVFSKVERELSSLEFDLGLQREQ